MSSRTRTSTVQPRGRARRTGLRAKTVGKNPFLALVPTVKAEIDTRLQGFLDAAIDDSKNRGSEIVEMMAAVADLCMRGGKRLRPALVVTGCRAASVSIDLEPALDTGVAIELLQAYFLIHDDWMDRDSVRRGGPTVHEHLSKRFRSRRIGHASAILAGDCALGLSTDALARVEVEAGRVVRLFSCFAQMQLDAIAGQQLDIVGRPRDVETLYALKTGSYTVRGPLRLGAILAGASPRLLSALDRFALPIGIAFQLRDDLLSAFGDPKQTGKPFGSDLRRGKRTLLLNHALKRARGREHRVLDRVIGNPAASDAEVRRAVEIIEQSGARDAVEQRIQELVSEARTALGSGRITDQGLELLNGATDALTARRT
jgi:geranylgeranyl diphosphate synthase, type I